MSEVASRQFCRVVTLLLHERHRRCRRPMPDWRFELFKPQANVVFVNLT